MSEFSVTVRAKVALHTSGTKFYETILLQRPGADVGVLYRHYGKANQLRGAGMSKIERFDVGNAYKEEGLLWTKKGRRGEYTESIVVDHGFYDLLGPHYKEVARHCGAVATPHEITSVAELRAALLAHRIDKTSVETIISDLEGRDEAYDPTGGVVVEDPTLSDVPVTRGDDWGQW